MTTEAATFISDLDSTNPAGSQGAGFGDDHLRLLKAVLQSTFPSITGAVTLTHSEINSWATQTLTSGNGITATGALLAGATVSLDINGLASATPTTSDTIPLYDATAGGVRKATLENVATAINGSVLHDSLSGFVADEHIPHSSITFTAGAGLTGGGTLAGSRTFDVGAGNGITVSADSVAMSGSYTGTFTATVDVRAGSDRALKENIGDIENPLEMVRAMRGRSYWRKDVGQRQFGVIAQEHARVQPEAVGRDEASGYLTVAYQQITPILIEAVKALAHRIEMLEQES